MRYRNGTHFVEFCASQTSLLEPCDGCAARRCYSHSRLCCLGGDSELFDRVSNCLLFSAACGQAKIALAGTDHRAFWVNYLMRMLAWVNLLSVDGLFTRFIRVFGVNYNWLDGSPITVILGLVYGYVPFLILPLFATLERLDWRLVDAARDLGANSRQAFRLVTLPMSKAGLVAAGILIALPMFGDYYTNDLLHAHRALK